MARESDFGVTDLTYFTYTHLGHVVKTGDTVLGYDLVHAVTDDDLSVAGGLGGAGHGPSGRSISSSVVDVILVKKVYDDSDGRLSGGGRVRRKGRRKVDDRQSNVEVTDPEEHVTGSDELDEDDELAVVQHGKVGEEVGVRKNPLIDEIRSCETVDKDLVETEDGGNDGWMGKLC